MAANLVPPEALKQVKPYVTLASQLEQRNENAVAFYCRAYAVQYGMTINRSAPECKKFLAQIMDIVEGAKKTHKNDEAIQSEIVGQAYVEKYALRIFETADGDDRQSKFNKNLVKQFYTAGLLFDVLNYFGDLSEDLVVKKQYAKRKAMYLNKCFQTGEAPIPGPLLGEGGAGQDDGDDEGVVTGATGGPSNSSYSAPYPNVPNIKNEPNNQYHGYEQPPADRPSSKSNRSSYEPAPTNYYDSSANEQQPSAAAIPPALMAKAQKHCKHATSALQYDDIKTAIQNLEDCLKILKTGKD